MFNLLKKNADAIESQKDNKGFSLVELIVVLLIMSIMAGIAVPLYLNQKNRQLASIATSTSNTAQTNPKASTGNIAASQTNADPKNGPVEVDSTQYEQCEGINLAFYAYTSNVLLSMSNNDPVCS